MKDAEVPQDRGAVYDGQLRRLTWAVGGDGAYRGVPSTGWEAEIGATAVSIDRNNERIRAAWTDAREGRASPLAYHLAVNLLDDRTAALELGTCAWRVRRHQRPGPWGALSASWRAQYARLLGVAEGELDHLPEGPELYAGGTEAP